MMTNHLAEFIKRFDPETINFTDRDFIAEGVKEIIEDYLMSRSLPLEKKEERISYNIYVGDTPKQIFLKPDNILSAMALQAYATHYQDLQKPEQLS